MAPLGVGLSLLIFIFSTLSATAMSPTAHPSPSPHPTVHSNSTDCVAWVDRCTGEHHCTAGGGNSTNTSKLTPHNCYPLIPADLTPAPGVCTHINGSCQFVDPCVTWNKYCYGADYQCTEQPRNSSCQYHPASPPPPPKEECLPINGSCQLYNPCRKWPGFCGGPYQCITDIQYYRYTHGPQPDCPEPLHHPIPPGECIYQHGECVWSNCTSWLDICASYWHCGTQYDLQAYQSLPPPPCPPPPYPGPQSYLPQPGPCNYNITGQQCNYIVNKTHPCELAICPYGNTCEVYAPTNTAYCQPSCHINNGGCPTGDKCTLVNMTYCYITPCPMVVNCTQAVDTSPCAMIKCSVGYRCMVDNITGTGYCDPSCDLNNGGCPADQQCVLKQVQCITSPCPPVVECTEGPMCKAWVDRCTGEHHCTAGGGNSTNTSTLTPPNCYPPIPADLTPAPGVCTRINGSCQFVDPCVTWNECYRTEYHCTTKAQYQNNTCYYITRPPPPKEECLPINGSCQQYNPCRKWPGFCGGPYQCITDVQYYRYTHGPQPGCPVPEKPRQKPPGECIYQKGQCVWSNCTSYIDQCGLFWSCDSHFYYQIVRSWPPHPCPAPTHGNTPPPQPGQCLYDLTAQRCQYIVNETHPCDTAICPTGSVCQVYIGTPTNITYCQPSCEIDNGGCKRGETCSLVNQTCLGKPCPLQVKCTSPCATIRCSVGYRCMVDNITGTGYCNPSCDLNNGGCPADQQCVLKQVQCITSPCPPVVECTARSCNLSCSGNMRCVISNRTTGDSECMPSCFIGNGGCRTKEICTYTVPSECGSRFTPCQLPTNVQCSALSGFSGQCIPGMVFTECGSMCLSTCEDYIKYRNRPVACPAVCVIGCLCPPNLVQFRDRCVNPLECATLLSDPPPIDPLPQMPDTVLIEFTLTDTTVDAFMANSSSFLTLLRQLLIKGGMTHVVVKVYAAISAEDNSNNRDTATPIIVVIQISSDRIEQGLTSDQVLGIIQDNMASLGVTVAGLSTVNSQYGSIGGNTGISPAVVAGIVVGVVVFVGVLLTAVIIISVYTRATYKRKQQQSSTSMIGSYSVLKGSLLNDD